MKKIPGHDISHKNKALNINCLMMKVSHVAASRRAICMKNSSLLVKAAACLPFC